MAAYLCAMVAEFGVDHAPDDALRRALFYYNHTRTIPIRCYVNGVLGFALRVGTGRGGSVRGQVGGHA
jgi:hypothetical protein